MVGDAEVGEDEPLGGGESVEEGVGAEGSAQVGFDEAEDQQPDADDGYEGLGRGH